MNTENTENNKKNEEKNFNVGELVTNTEQFVERNQKVIITIICVVVLCVVGYFAYKHFYSVPKEESAQKELFAAQRYFEQEDYDKALKGDGKHQGLLSIKDEYSSTKAGKLAAYYIGCIYLNQGEFQKAIDNLSDFSSDDRIMSSQAKAMTGDAYAELNQLDKAISAYQDAAKADNDLTTPFVLLKMGQIYEIQKKNDKALECYKKIKQQYPSSMEYREIEKYISRLEAMK